MFRDREAETVVEKGLQKQKGERETERERERERKAERVVAKDLQKKKSILFSRFEPSILYFENSFCNHQTQVAAGFQHPNHCSTAKARFT